MSIAKFSGFSNIESKIECSKGLVSRVIFCGLLFYAFSAVADEPVVTSLPVITVDEDSVYRYLLEATDADNDPLSWAVKEGYTLPLWLSLSANALVTTSSGSG
ncbi:MAG: hypothetical protein HRT35_34820, partial [Algicola sp.]|nr:hypothetical protein [Algicola sp.]